MQNVFVFSLVESFGDIKVGSWVLRILGGRTEYGQPRKYSELLQKKRWSGTGVSKLPL